MRNLLIFMLLVGIFVLGIGKCMHITHFFKWGTSIHGEGPVVTEARTPGAFQRLDLSGSADVQITIGDTPSLIIEGQKNIIDALKTEVKNGELDIYFDSNVSYDGPLTVKITTASLEGIEVSGSGHIKLLSPLQAEKMKIDISGSSTIEAKQLNLRRLDCGVSGSGDIRLGGYAAESRYDVGGSGAIQAFDLQTDRCEADIAGSGDVRCSVNQDLDAHVGGSGTIVYRGNPSVKEDISGAGSVRKE